MIAAPLTTVRASEYQRIARLAFDPIAEERAALGRQRDEPRPAALGFPHVDPAAVVLDGHVGHSHVRHLRIAASGQQRASDQGTQIHGRSIQQPLCLGSG